MSARRAGCCVMALVVLLLLPAPARADVELELNLGARSVGVGEPFRVDLSAMSQDGDSPSDPRLTAPDAFEIEGPTVGTRQQVSINGMRMVRQNGIGATWILSATRAGIYSIGPASVRTRDGVQRSASVQIQVLDQPNPANRLGGRRRRGPDRSIACAGAPAPISIACPTRPMASRWSRRRIRSPS
jgi:hypothetical protein